MIRSLIDLYVLLLIVDTILSYLPQFRHQEWRRKIGMAADFTCKPVRKLLPPDLPIDPSPIVVILLLNLLKVLW
ncbi:MAG: hypothetical protein GY909_01945 [Oligoflexia bacterium]|nr:hypothetical protein [Oligoflexia bacterium]